MPLSSLFIVSLFITPILSPNYSQPPHPLTIDVVGRRLGVEEVEFGLRQRREWSWGLGLGPTEEREVEGESGVSGEEDGVVFRWEWVGLGLGEVDTVEVVDWDVSVVVEREFEGVECGGVWV